MSLTRLRFRKRALTLAAIIVLIAVIAIGTAACNVGLSPPSRLPSVSGSIVFGQQNTGIWVNGEGKVTVTPDVAILSVGIESQETSVAQAQEKAATAMNAVISQLKQSSIAEKDIRTTSFSIIRVTRFDEPKQQEITIGYRVTNMVTAKIRSLVQESFPLDYKLGRIIDAVAQAGGDLTRINNISFTVDDPTAFEREVRQKAMADAENKAKQLANLSGVKLGKPIYINESGGFISLRQEFFAVPAPAPAFAGAPTPILPGEQEIRLNVQVVYEID
jgi:hypothetical protein